MISKNKIKYIKSLHLKKYRLQERKFILEGPKIIKELLHSSYTIETIYAASDWIEGQKILLSPIRQIVFDISTRDMKTISGLNTPSEALAVVHLPESKQLRINETQGFHLYLDSIRDPGNLGTLIRSAAWFGLQQIICSPDCVDYYNHKVLQSSMASFLHIELITASFEEMKTSLPSHAIVGASLEGEELAHFTKPAKMVLLIGNEGQGIDPSHLQACTTQITIPKHPSSKTESLNAAVSGAILMNTFCTS